MSDKKWLLYGATGYTGKLIVDYAKKQGLTPILAGRNPSKLMELAKPFGWEVRAFSLDSKEEISRNIQDCELVLHCAGPFIETAESMAEACIASKTHYLDITGEIPVYELLQAKHDRAVQSSVLLLPGVGFDIVPTDCVAAQIKRWLPDANELHLGFMGLGGISAGTAKSALAQAPYGSKVRRGGNIQSIPQFQLKREFHISGKRRTLYSIPWGDVFTAYYSTGIPDISVYTYVPDEVVRFSKFTNLALPLLKNNLFLGFAQGAVNLLVKGPDEITRETGMAIVLGYGRNSAGKEVEIEIHTAEGYKFTALSALLAVQKVLNPSGNKDLPVGFATPSLAFGADFVYEIPGTILQN